MQMLNIYFFNVQCFILFQYCHNVIYCSLEWGNQLFAQLQSS